MDSLSGDVEDDPSLTGSGASGRTMVTTASDPVLDSMTGDVSTVGNAMADELRTGNSTI